MLPFHIHWSGVLKLCQCPYVTWFIFEVIFLKSKAFPVCFHDWVCDRYSDNHEDCWCSWFSCSKPEFFFLTWSVFCFYFNLNPESVIQLVVHIIEQVTLDSMWILHFFHILPFKNCFQHVKGEGFKRSSSVFLHLLEKHLSV